MSSQSGSQSGPSGFFGALFDFSFSHFVTTRIIKVLYVLGIIAVAVWALSLVAGAFRMGGAAIIPMLLLAVIGFFVGIIYLRIVLEFIMIVFRIADNTSAIVHNTGGGAGSGLSPTMPPPAAPEASSGPQAPPPPGPGH